MKIEHPDWSAAKVIDDALHVFNEEIKTKLDYNNYWPQYYKKKCLGLAVAALPCIKNINTDTEEKTESMCTALKAGGLLFVVNENYEVRTKVKLIEAVGIGNDAKVIRVPDFGRASVRNRRAKDENVDFESSDVA